jgi:methylmalonyl-CoA mutase N-terminal domain/subunit
MRNRFGATEPRAQQLRFHAQTAGSTLTAQQPDTNIVRVTLQALAAVLGGAQSIHTNSRDEALGLPTEDSATIALRTQQILLHESGLTQVVDPFGGSYAIEEMTDRIERDARRSIEALDEQGGVLAAIERGFVQREIQESAYRTQRAIDAGEQVVVGVNRFVDGTAASSAAAFRLAPEIERAQVERVRALRASRSAADTQVALERVERAARDGTNLVPAVLAAVEARATLGEIADSLRGVFGEYRESAGV